MADVAWGLVTQVTPTVQVRFAGDTVDVTVTRGNAALTLATNDRVVLLKVGTQWTVAYKLGTL